MEIKKLDSPVSISDSALVRLKEMGNITEIMYSEKRSRGGYITKIDKDHYFAALVVSKCALNLLLRL